jgi:glycosyltransferase involved in cell wall biosynthesis
MLISEFRALNRLRAVPGEQLVHDHSEYTRIKFDAAAVHDGVIPVIIPVRNEAEDLPATLYTLARSREPVLPVVVNNGSKDNTEGLAREMGAHVCNWALPGKMGATQRGIAYVNDELGSNLALFTDGDALLRPGWAAAMRRVLNACQATQGASVWGPRAYAHGESKTADAVRSAMYIAKAAVRAKRKGSLPRATGVNYGLLLDPAGAIRSAIDALDSGIFSGDDRAIRDAVARAGGQVVGSISLSTLVISRGDRMTLKDLLSSPAAREASRRESYEGQYGALPAYDDTLE